MPGRHGVLIKHGVCRSGHLLNRHIAPRDGGTLTACHKYYIFPPFFSGTLKLDSISLRRFTPSLVLISRPVRILLLHLMESISIRGPSLVIFRCGKCFAYVATRSSYEVAAKHMQKTNNNFGRN